MGGGGGGGSALILNTNNRIFLYSTTHSNPNDFKQLSVHRARSPRIAKSIDIIQNKTNLQNSRKQNIFAIARHFFNKNKQNTSCLN
jgi:hypothetical protein